VESKVLFPKLDDMENRTYLYKILEALEYSHSMGIMHRDVKPLNVVVDPRNKDLRLIDWGLADFYKEGQEYNVRVASRYFKGPELLVDDKLYHYSLDIWSTGCTMAGMIFRIEPFFKGADNYDQLIQVAKIMGTENLQEYMRNYNLTLPSQCKKAMRNFAQIPLEKFVDRDNQHLVSNEALDLLYRMLTYDKNKRITPADAMAHPWFDPVRKECQEATKK
jgi:casein kinase II subunit alpha